MDVRFALGEVYRPLLMAGGPSREFFKNHRRDTGTVRIAADPCRNGRQR